MNGKGIYKYRPQQDLKRFTTKSYPYSGAPLTHKKWTNKKWTHKKCDSLPNKEGRSVQFCFLPPLICHPLLSLHLPFNSPAWVGPIGSLKQMERLHTFSSPILCDAQHATRAHFMTILWQSPPVECTGVPLVWRPIQQPCSLGYDCIHDMKWMVFPLLLLRVDFVIVACLSQLII